MFVKIKLKIKNLDMSQKLLTKLLTPLLLVIFCFHSIGETLNEQYYFNRLATDGENIWIATSKGVVRYNKTENKTYNANDVLGIDENSIVNCIKTDKKGNLWYSVEGEGVYFYDGDKYESHFDFYKENLLRLSFAFDSNDSIWVSAGGYYISPIIIDSQIGYTTPDNYSSTQNAYIMDMEFDSKENLWISIFGEYNSLLCHKTDKSICETIIEGGNTVIPTLTMDDNDNIWYTLEKSIVCYNTTSNEKTEYWNSTNKEIPAAHFFASDIDYNHNIWFTSSHYLLRYDGKNFKWWNSYGYHDPRAILCDGERVWILMKNDVLFKFEEETFDKIDLSLAVAGIEESIAEESNTKAYVSNGILYIESSEEIANVKIYDAMGREVLAHNPTQGETSVEIALPNVKGVLIVKVNSEAIKVISNK